MMHYSRAIKFNGCHTGGPHKPSCTNILLTSYFLLLTSYLFLILFSIPVYATNLSIRGMARGESRIKVGDKAPLITEELQRAHEEGKVIALMLGYQTHCPWCDRMDRYIRYIMKKVDNFDNRVAFIQTQVEHAKMIPPPPEGEKLKAAYGVEGQPWLFIIDKAGTVQYVYKIFISSDVFVKNISGLLGDDISLGDILRDEDIEHEILEGEDHDKHE
jgi:thioredoxin-related protein